MTQLAAPQRVLRTISNINVIPDNTSEEALVARLTTPEGPTMLSFINQHGFNLAWKDPSFGELLSNSDFLLRDGIGMKVCLYVLGIDSGKNMNGTDLIPRIVTSYHGRRGAVFGSKSPWLDHAVDSIAQIGTEVVTRLDGFQSLDAYVVEFKKFRPEIVLLGMGMPKQEMVADALAEIGGPPTLIVNGGAILDFLGGRFERAPIWMRRSGLEWLFRLALEPQRLWPRYGPGGFLFLCRIAMLRATASRNSFRLRSEFRRRARTHSPL